MGRNIKAGRVWTNCYHAYPAHAAFGGYKQSGIGRENHRMMLHHYQQTKNLLVSYSPKALGFFCGRVMTREAGNPEIDQVSATPAAVALRDTLRARHGALRFDHSGEIGRATGRERVGRAGETWEESVPLENETQNK